MTIFIIIIASWSVLTRKIYLEHDCHIVQETACQVYGPDEISFTFSMKPRPLNPSKPFILRLTPSKTQFDQVSATLIGLSFSHQPVAINLLKRKEGYEGESLFPFCSEKKMKWRIHLELKKGQNTYISNFDFEVIRS